MIGLGIIEIAILGALGLLLIGGILFMFMRRNGSDE